MGQHFHGGIKNNTTSGIYRKRFAITAWLQIPQQQYLFFAGHLKKGDGPNTMYIM